MHVSGCFHRPYLLAAVCHRFCGAGSHDLESRLHLVCRGQCRCPAQLLLVQSFRVQAAVFIAVSALCLLAFKPLAKKLRKAPTATNGDRNLGREATVLTPVTAEATGRVRLDGVDWNARCVTPGDILAPGESCRVTEIHSTLLIVEPIRTETTH